MSLLTDEEMDALFKAHYDKNQCIDTLLLAFEAAIMAKLASAELPEPAMEQMLSIGTKFSSENWGERSFNEIDFYSAACEIFKLGQSQAYAQGAAAQLSAEPDYIKWRGKGEARPWRVAPAKGNWPLDPALTETEAFPLYTRRQAND